MSKARRVPVRILWTHQLVTSTSFPVHSLSLSLSHPPLFLNVAHFSPSPSSFQKFSPVSLCVVAPVGNMQAASARQRPHALLPAGPQHLSCARGLVW